MASRFENTDKRARRRYGRQKGSASKRAMYGSLGRPAPVIVRTLDGQVRSADQSEFERRPASKRLERLAREAGFESYAAYLLSPHWRRLRAWVLNRDHWRCRKCGSRHGLHVHHRWYSKLGSEDPKSLVTLCQNCHGRVHRADW